MSDNCPICGKAFMPGVGVGIGVRQNWTEEQRQMYTARNDYTDDLCIDCRCTCPFGTDTVPVQERVSDLVYRYAGQKAVTKWCTPECALFIKGTGCTFRKLGDVK